MTKKQLTEKWTEERGKAAGEASKLNVKLAGLNERVKRFTNMPQQRAQAVAERTKVLSYLHQHAARVITIDQFLKDI